MSPKNSKGVENNKSEKRILWFKEINIKDIPFVGGKNASLGEMYNNLTKKGVPVPNGFAVTAKSFWELLETGELKKKIKNDLKSLDITDVRKLHNTGKKIRQQILDLKFPKDLENEIVKSYEKLASECGNKNLAVAVRSSATAEDLPDASFAGQQESYLNVVGKKELLLAVKKCIASLFNDRAISYRETKGFDHLSVALSVTVQKIMSGISARTRERGNEMK